VLFSINTGLNYRASRSRYLFVIWTWLVLTHNSYKLPAGLREAISFSMGHKLSEPFLGDMHPFMSLRQPLLPLSSIAVSRANVELLLSVAFDYSGFCTTVHVSCACSTKDGIRFRIERPCLVESLHLLWSNFMLRRPRPKAAACLDLNLPLMTGHELLVAPSFRKLCVLILSGEGCWPRD